MAESGESPQRRRGVPLRALCLCLLLCGMLGVLWQRWQTEGAAQRKKVVDHQAALSTNARPVDRPDFLDGPVYDISAKPDSLLESWYQSAGRATVQVEAAKLQKKLQRPSARLALPDTTLLKTEQQLLRRYYEFRLRELQAYKDHTRDTGASREAGAAFLAAYLDRATNQPQALTRDEIRELGARALTAGSRDPVVRTYLAFEDLQITGDSAAAVNVWNETIPELMASKYPRIIQVFARYFAYEVAREEFRGPSVRRGEAVAVAVAQWLEEESQSSEWTDCVCLRLMRLWEGDHGRLHAPILTACLNSSKIDAAYVHTLAGLHHIRAGWMARGGGFANEVKTENWGPFRDHLRKARTHLQYAWLLHPELPHAPSALIEVSMADPEVSYQCYDWFLRSCEAQLDFWSSYTRFRNALRPRWGGSLKDMILFAQRCQETQRYDTFLPYIMLDILDDMDRVEFAGDAKLWAPWKPGLMLLKFVNDRDAYRLKHPDAPLYGDTAYYRTRAGLLLDKFDFPALARDEFLADVGVFDRGQLQAGNHTGMFWLRRLHAAQGPERARVLQLDQQLRHRWPAETPDSVFTGLQQEIEQLKDSATDEWGRDYYLHAARIVEHLRAYTQGEWVSLSFADGPLGWEIRADEFDASDGTDRLQLNRRYGMTTHVWARPLAHFEPPFEVEATLDYAEEVSELGPFGIVWQQAAESYYGDPRDNGVFVGLSRQRREQTNEIVEFADFSTSASWNGERNWTRNSRPGPRKLSLKLWTQHHEALVGGSWRVVEHAQPIPVDALLSFGTPTAVMSGSLKPERGDLLISGIRIRRLTIPPPPPAEAAADDRSNYWGDRIQVDPADLIARAQLAAVRLEQERYADVCEIVEAIQEQHPEFDRVRHLSARSLMLLGRYHEAWDELERVGDEPFDHPLISITRAEIFAAAPVEELRNGTYAKGNAQQAIRRGGPYQALAAGSLAAAWAELGDFEQALQENQRAIDLAEDDRFQRELQRRQTLYENKQPFRMEVRGDSPAVEATSAQP